MKRLNQILAVEQATKKKREDEFTKLYQELQKADLSAGFTRTYQPKDEEGERFPNETKRVQVRVPDTLQSVKRSLADLFDMTATKDATNQTARADIVVNGQVLATGVPATHLLFLEKKMVGIIELLKKLPTLPMDEQWTLDSVQGLYATAPTETIKTAKVVKHEVVVQATEKFPAQVVQTTKDVVQGTWKTVKFSGALPSDEVSELLARAERLQKAIKTARQEANEAPVTALTTSQILNYIFE